MTMDVQSFSYEYSSYDAFHVAVPWRPVGGGESGSCVADRGEYGPANATTGHVGSSNAFFSCIAEAWTAVAARPWVFGNFLWTGQDYQGETYPLGWPDVSSHFGIHGGRVGGAGGGGWQTRKHLCPPPPPSTDLAGFPKDAVGYYQAWWRAGAARNCSEVFLSPTDWTAPVAPGDAVDVFAFSCAAAVSLSVNGVPVGQAQAVPPFGYVRWPAVRFEPGSLTATALDADGHALGSATVVTAGPPVALTLLVRGRVSHGHDPHRRPTSSAAPSPPPRRSIRPTAPRATALSSPRTARTQLSSPRLWWTRRG